MLQEALKPRLRSAGVHAVERRIGKPRRFFENVRHRGTLRVDDFLAACAALDLEPGELLTAALAHETSPEVRAPAIVEAARKQIEQRGQGLGRERLAELEAAVQARPRQTLKVLGRELRSASPPEVPRLLSLYATGLRLESDPLRAELVLRRARELVRKFDLRAEEPDVLVRMAYVALESERLDYALRCAQEATLASTRLGDREGQGRGFLTIGMIQYYTAEHSEALESARGALSFFSNPHYQSGAHQLAALCYAAVEAMDEAWQETSIARSLAKDSPEWIQGKISWLESRLHQGAERLKHLQRARASLCPARPVDCAIATVELIEQALICGDDRLADREAMDLCALLERDPSPRITRAVLELGRLRSKLTPSIVARIRRSLERVRNRSLLAIIPSEF